MGKKPKQDQAQSGGDARYGEELLSANWNPVIDLIEWSCAKTLDDVRDSAERDLSEADVDALLHRIYSLGGSP